MGRGATRPSPEHKPFCITKCPPACSAYLVGGVDPVVRRPLPEQAHVGLCGRQLTGQGGQGVGHEGQRMDTLAIIRLHLRAGRQAHLVLGGRGGGGSAAQKTLCTGEGLTARHVHSGATLQQRGKTTAI